MIEGLREKLTKNVIKMVHIKRFNIKKTWDVAKKEKPWIVKSNPGKLSLLSIPLETLLKEVSDLATTKKEVLYLLSEGIYLNGKRVKDRRFPIGLFDVLSFESEKDDEVFYRLVLKKGKLSLKTIDKKEKDLTILKIVSKNKISRKTKKGKETGFNYGLIDSSNYFTDESFSTNGSFIYNHNKKEKVDYLPLEKGTKVMVISRKHIGKIGTVEEVSDDFVLIKNEDHLLKTKSKNVYVLGKKIKITI